MIAAGQPADASDFVSTSSGAADSGKVAKLNADGKYDPAFAYAPTAESFTAGENINPGDPVYMSQTDENIAFDAGATSSTASATSLTFSHTCSRTNRILFVGIKSAGTISSVTYGGVAMTFINQANNTEYWNLYYLIAPAQGANNVVITMTASTDIYAISASYYGARQSSVPDAQTTNTNYGTSVTGTVTTVADNSWVVAFGGQSAGTGTTSAGAGTTLRVAGSSAFNFYDSNSVVHPAGSKSLTINDNTTDELGMCVASFAPAAGTPSPLVYRANAGQASTANPFIGFAPLAIASGATGSVTLAGIATGLTGLTLGSQYYLANTPGVSTTPGTVTRKVGIAVSTTELLVTNTW